MVLLLAGWILAGNVVEVTLIQVLPGLAICFRVDAFGIVFALVSSFLWMVAAAYTVGYMRGLAEHAQTRFFICFALAPLCGRRSGVFRQSADTVSVLRDAVAFHLAPGGPSPGQREPGRGA